jgi:hypothetical protein
MAAARLMLLGIGMETEQDGKETVWKQYGIRTETEQKQNGNGTEMERKQNRNESEMGWGCKSHSMNSLLLSKK